MRTEFARVDPVTLETGLFKALPKGAHMESFVGLKTHGTVAYSYAASAQIDHIGLRVFLVLCGLAAMTPQLINRAVNGSSAQGVWQGLETLGDATEGYSTAWMGDLSTLVKECGLTTAGSNRTRVLDRLQHLASVRIERRDAQSGRLLGSEQLLSFVMDSTGKRILVALSPHVSKSVSKELGGQYVHVCLNTLRAIAEPAGQVLHAVLSNRIRESQTKMSRYGVDKLAEIAYPDSFDMTKAAQAKRKRSVAQAMKGLDRAGWGVFPPLDGAGNVYGIIRGERVDPSKWAYYQRLVA